MHIISDLSPSVNPARTFSDELLLAVTDLPSDIDQAWESGFGLAADGVPALAPSHYSPAERSAWEHGYSCGVEMWERETAEEVARMEAEFVGRHYDPYENWG